MQRGKIYNRERAKQLKDFSGLRFRNITPTDIDGFFEFGDTLFVFFEAKQIGAPLPDGQKLGLIRICDAINGTRNEHGRERVAVLIVIEHDEKCEQDIDFAPSPVTALYRDRKWQPPEYPTSCLEAVEQLLLELGIAWHYLSVKRWREIQQAETLVSR